MEIETHQVLHHDQHINDQKGEDTYDLFEVDMDQDKDTFLSDN